MSDAKAVQEISQRQREHNIDCGVVRQVRGQYIDVMLDGGRRQVRDVILAKSVTEVEVGWWVVLVRIPRSRRWVALVALESMTGGSRPTAADLSQPGSVAATGKPYLIHLSWAGSFQDAATYEVQHNSSGSESGATTLKVEGSNFLYWCNPGTERYFRVRAVSSAYERSSWSGWVSASATQGDSYMSLCVTAAGGASWMPFDWDNVSGVLQADMVHNHNTAAEGGVELWPDRLGVGTASIPAMDGVIGLPEVADRPPFAPNEGRIYCKDAAGRTELYYVDDAGAEVQITSGGGLPGVSDHGGLTGLADDDHSQYLLADGTRALTGAWDVGAHLVTFGAGITFDGASGANKVTVPDAVPLAWELWDDGGVPIEYVRVVSTDANPYMLIDPAAAGICVGVGLEAPQGIIHGNDGYGVAIAAALANFLFVTDDGAGAGHNLFSFAGNTLFDATIILASTRATGTASYLFGGRNAANADGSGGTTMFSVRTDGQGYFAGPLGIKTAVPGAHVHAYEPNTASNNDAKIIIETVDTLSDAVLAFYTTTGRNNAILFYENNVIEARLDYVGGSNALVLSSGNAIANHLVVADGGKVGMNGVAVPSTALDIGAGAFELDEMAAPGGGAANTCRIYAVDNAGKTELYAIFNTGVAQLIAAEP